jgi:SAM-dependent methyltransferase
MVIRSIAQRIKTKARNLMVGYSIAKRPRSEEAQRVAEYWATDHKIDLPRSWMDHPVIRSLIYERVTGNTSLSAIEWFQKTYLPRPVDAALSIGCGLGAFERNAIQMKIAERISAIDISPGAIETARREAARAEVDRVISYEVLDLNTEALPRAVYSVVFGLSSIHHILNLDHAFEQIYRSLKPGGLLFLDEYIGPRQFQTPPHVTAIINRELSRFPESRRKSLYVEGAIVNSYTPPTIAQMNEIDPSEAIRSDQIVEKVAKRFDILEFRPYGGGILHMMLSGIAGNFSPDNSEDVAILQRLFALELELEKAGQIQSDFAAIVARPKSYSVQA